MTVRVLIDRDSVHAGDDVEGHGVLLDLDDVTSIGDAIVAMIDRHFLASVRGPVGWAVGLHHEAEYRSEPSLLHDGPAFHVRYGSGSVEEVAMIYVPLDAEPLVAPTSRRGLGEQVRDAVRPGADGIRAIRARYVPSCALLRVDDFRATTR